MRKFRGFFIKELNHIIRDTRTLMILFVLPVVLLLIFGYVVTNELKDIRIAVFDQSNDRYTRDLTGHILSSGYFILDKTIGSEDEIGETFRQGRVKMVIVFEKDFGVKLNRDHRAGVQLIADASDANMANLVVNYTTAIIRNYTMGLNAGADIPFRAEPRVRMVYNEHMDGAFMFVPGTMAMILMLVSALMTSISIAREKELGTMETLLVSPLRPGHIILGKVAPYIGLSFINASAIILIGYFVFGLPVRGNVPLLLAECLLFIAVALSLGILISTLANSQQTAMFMSLLALLLPTILLSGFIFPVENMPTILQWLSYIVPAKYFIIIIKDIMIKGTGLIFVWKETLVLAGMMALFLFVSSRRFRIRLE